MKNFLKWQPFHKYALYENFEITDPPPPKFGSPVFWVLTEMEYWHEKIDKWLPFYKYVSYRKIKITDPPQSLHLWFTPWVTYV